MTDAKRTLSGLDAEHLCDELNYLAVLLGGPVAMVVIQEQDGKLSFLSHPDAAGDVFRYMAGVDWADAGRIADGGP